jgi:hypothetical protein
MSVWPKKVWTAGRTCYRVYRAEYGPKSFNPNTGADLGDLGQGGRFHPFEDRHGNRIPTMYVADHSLGAISETLMRDSAPNRKLKLDDLRQNHLATLRFKIHLQLVDLNPPLLDDGFASLLKEDKSVYLETRRLAASIHATETWAHGLYWSGKQLDISAMKCMVLFGDRIQSADVEILECCSLGKEPELTTLREAAVYREFTLPEEFI